MKLPPGYCMNVHAGQDLASIIVNLRKYALAVREKLEADTLPVGLWFPVTVAHELEQPKRLAELAATLQELQLLPYTLNGFPYGNFHQEIVKFDVYRPTWWDPARTHYTLLLAAHLAELLPEGASGSISTLPLGWPRQRCRRGTASCGRKSAR